MARTAKNQLTIRPIDGTNLFYLSGYCNGNQVRLKNPDITILEAKKKELEAEVFAETQLLASAPSARYSYLTEAQLRDAEAAFKALQRSHHNSTLLEAVTVGIAHLATGGNMNATATLNEWQDYQETVEGLYETTLKANRDMVEAFIKFSKVVTLGEITPRSIEGFSTQGKVKAGTRLTRVSRINAWLNFCVKKKYLNSNPLDIDLTALADRAKREREPGRIITTEMAEALLNAAATMHGGVMAPYAILSTWCFMRNAEVLRTLPENVRFNNTNTVDVFPRKAGTVSHRRVKIPENVTALLKDCIESGVWKKGKGVTFSRVYWDDIREAAGIIVRGKAKREGAHRPIIGGIWQENILRHTGVSYHYQKFGDITETARQAGHSIDVAFKHYISLPEDGDAAKFYSIRAVLKKEIAQDCAQNVA